MITKGIVEEIITPYEIKVRLPLLDGIKESRQGVQTSDLSNAIISSLPNSENNVSVGDIVIVGFEDEDLGKPIILGHLYKETVSETQLDLTLRKLSTTSSTILSEETSIGEVTKNEIKALKNIRFNIQNQLDNIVERLNTLENNNNN